MTSDDEAPGVVDERLAAYARAADLVGLPWLDRLRCVRENSAYSRPSFIELAVGLARDTQLSPAEREGWARLALEATHRGTSRRAEQLEPLAWAVLGTIHRVRGRLVASHDAFRRCRPLRHRLTDPLELADTYSKEAAYWSEIGDEWSGGQKALARAVELADEALRLAAPRAASRVVGFYEIQAGLIANRAKRWSAAMAMLFSALDRIDPAEDPRLALVAGHNLAMTAMGLGRLDTAMFGLLRLQGEYDRHPELRLPLNRDWLMARIAKRRGQRREAEARFLALRESLVKASMLYGAAGVDLALAELAEARGQRAAARRLAARAFRGLSAAGAPYAARAASRLLRKVA